MLIVGYFLIFVVMIVGIALFIAVEVLDSNQSSLNSTHSTLSTSTGRPASYRPKTLSREQLAARSRKINRR